jgi:hypothetical protein
MNEKQRSLYKYFGVTGLCLRVYNLSGRATVFSSFSFAKHGKEALSLRDTQDMTHTNDKHDGKIHYRDTLTGSAICFDGTYCYFSTSMHLRARNEMERALRCTFTTAGTNESMDGCKDGYGFHLLCCIAMHIAR